MEKNTVIKIPLKEIIKDKQKIAVINDSVNKVNKLVIHVYQFLELFILHQEANKKLIPEINDNLITQIFNIFTKDTPNKNTNKENSELFYMLETFRKKYYDNLHFDQKIDKKYLSNIIEYATTEIITNIENNIKSHFIEHIKKYIKKHFEQSYFDNTENINKKINEHNKKLQNLKPLNELENDFKIEENIIFKKILKCDNNNFEKYDLIMKKLNMKLNKIRIKFESDVKNYSMFYRSHNIKINNYKDRLKRCENNDPKDDTQIKRNEIKSEIYKIQNDVTNAINIDEKYFNEVKNDRIKCYIKFMRDCRVLGVINKDTMFGKKISDRLNNLEKIRNITFENYLKVEPHQDLINNLIKPKLTSNKKYHDYVFVLREQLINFKDITVSLYIDVNNNPQKYLCSMIKLNRAFGKINIKQFHILPLRTNIIPKYCQIDTNTLNNLFSIKDVGERRNNLTKYKDIIWEENFDMQNRAFTKKDYVFDHKITTDGYSASILFLHSSFTETVKKKKENMANAQKNIKNMSKEQKEKHEFEKNKKEELIKEQQKQINKENSKIREEQNKRKTVLKQKLKKKNLSDEEKKLINQELENINNEQYKNRVKKKTVISNELKYFTEIKENTEEFNEFINGKKIYVDPGKRSLYTMIDDDGNIFSYRNKQRIRETKSAKYGRLLTNYRKREGIIEIEKLLSDYNSKSCNIEEFSAYISIKNQINSVVYDIYKNEIFRKYKWYSYINTRRSESNLSNKINKKYNENKDKNLIIILGDWDISKQMRHFKPTPNKHLKKLLTENFKVYEIDEYRTSKLHHKTSSVCGNLYLKNKEGKLEKKHSILSFKMKNKMGYLDRDKNSCKNMRKIVNHWITTGEERPKRYKRDYIMKSKMVVTIVDT